MYAGMRSAIVERALRVRSKRFGSTAFFAGLPQVLDSLHRCGKHGRPTVHKRESLPVLLLLLNGTRYSIVTGDKEAIERMTHVSIYIYIYIFFFANIFFSLYIFFKFRLLIMGLIMFIYFINEKIFFYLI